ncbi:MAG: Calx-beta domain-containing protein [bacterium]
MDYRGVISGSGGLGLVSAADWTAQNQNRIILSGSSNNTYTGTTTILQGQVQFGRTGACAIPGDLVLTQNGTNDAIVWAASEQIANAATVSVYSRYGKLLLNGYTETVWRVKLATGAIIDTGAGGKLLADGLQTNGVDVPVGTYTTNNASWVLGSGSVVVTQAVLTVLFRDGTTQSVGESAGSKTVTVKLNRASSQAASVQFATSDGSALAGRDYVATSGTLSWSAGETNEKPFQITITHDTLYESDESFFVTLFNPSNCVPAPQNPASITIVNDDPKPALPMVPWPFECSTNAGTMTVQTNSAIVVQDAVLLPLGSVLAEEMLAAHAMRLPVRQGAPNPGDIVLKLSLLPGVTGEAYRVTTDTHAVVEAAEYDGVAAGIVTLLQNMGGATNVVLPQMTVLDGPPIRSFRGLMIDMKNYWHSIGNFQQFIELCRFYKIRNLSLHSGEWQWIGAVMEQTAGLSAAQRATQRIYTKAEMDNLIAYAKIRGVHLFPHNESVERNR